jgi:hypothetical protein
MPGVMRQKPRHPQAASATKSGPPLIRVARKKSQVPESGQTGQAALMLAERSLMALVEIPSVETTASEMTANPSGNQVLKNPSQADRVGKVMTAGLQGHVRWGRVSGRKQVKAAVLVSPLLAAMMHARRAVNGRSPLNSAARKVGKATAQRGVKSLSPANRRVKASASVHSLREAKGRSPQSNSARTSAVSAPSLMRARRV